MGAGSHRSRGKGPQRVLLTEGKFLSVVESLKDLIKSTAKSTETVLRKEIREVGVRVDRTEVAILAHAKSIKKLEGRFDGLEGRFDGLEGRFDKLEVRFDGLEGRFGKLEGRFDKLEVRFDGLEEKFGRLDAKIDGVRTELKDEMHNMERRLSDKIDGHSGSLNDHEARISALEQCP